MKITYDEKANAAYIYLDGFEKEVVGPRAGGLGRTVDAEGDMLTMLDFDREGRLRGIEVLNAKERLHPSVLSNAERI